MSSKSDKKGTEDRQILASKIAVRWRSDKQFKDSLNLPKKWAQYERFKAGDQWGPVTPRTKALPRPVFNIIDHILNHKIAAVKNDNIKMVFTSMEGANEDYPDIEGAADQANMFSRYSETVWEELKQDQLNDEALDSSSNMGIGIWHYYWDGNVQGGKKLEYIGELKGETIDPMNIAFGDPQQRDVQKQPFILIRNRMSVDEIKEIAELNGCSPEELEQIRGDKDTKDNEYDNAQQEVKDVDKANVFTMYYKERVDVLKSYGEDEEYTVKEDRVYFAKACNGILIVPPTETELSLYPIAIMNWYYRKESIYGRGETEGLIPNQRTINRLLAMQVYGVELTGFPKLIYKSGAVDASKINNDPGEMIEDNFKGQGPGISYMLPGQINILGKELVDSFIQYTKDLKGATEANTGDMGSSQLNATAIMLLQKAAAIPIEGIKKRFYQSMEDIGRIWEEFYKKKYVTARLVNVKNEDNQDETLPFRGSDADGLDFKLKIEIGPSSAYTESFVITALDRFLDSGYITFDEYLKYAPTNVVPFKEQLIKDRQAQAEMQQEQMQMQLINSLNPGEKQMFDNATPEQQQAMIQALMQEQQQAQQMQGQPQQGQGPNKPSKPMPQQPGIPGGQQQ